MKINKKSKWQIWSALMLFTVGLFFGGTFGLSTSAEGVTPRSELVEKEDIDVVIKYIDLTDKNLKRKGIPQIKKDEDNGELKYAVRSVLKNLPWARHIYIVMPNEKVRYFKDEDEISDKIKYIKDKDLLGYDSASIHSFQFNFWRLPEFGVSKNFIYLDDDYFIGKPLEKSDFFYEEDGKVVPYVIYNKAVKRGQYKNIKSYYKNLKKELSGAHSHSSVGFQFQKTSGLMFLYKVLKKDLLMPAEDMMYFPHNALGENADELKEVYDVVKNNYKHANECLHSLLRSNKAFVHQTVYNFYILNKYNRRIHRLRGDYIDMKNVTKADFNCPLFCINTGGNFDYTDKDYASARVMMNKLFPNASPYERQELKNGVYTISSAMNSSKVMDVSNASRADGANVQLWSSNNTNAQKFNVKYKKSDGSYIISPLCSGKSLDVYLAGKEMGANIQQYSKNGTNAQKWYLIPAGRGYFNIVSACNNLCADVDNAGTADGTNIRCWEPNGTNAQKFRFIAVQ